MFGKFCSKIYHYRCYQQFWEIHVNYISYIIRRLIEGQNQKHAIRSFFVFTDTFFKKRNDKC